MKPTPTLIKALLTSAAQLEAGTFPYNWKAASQCNCGILACNLTGVDQPKLLERLQKELRYPNYWSCDSFGDYNGSNFDKLTRKNYCEMTGLSANNIIIELKKHGMEDYEDFKRIEWHSGRTLADVALSFRALAQELQAQLDATNPPAVPTTLDSALTTRHEVEATTEAVKEYELVTV